MHDIDDAEAEAEAECLSEHFTAAVLTDEARQYAMGLLGLSVEFDSEWSAERSAKAIYEYMRDRGRTGLHERVVGKGGPGTGR